MKELTSDCAGTEAGFDDDPTDICRLRMRNAVPSIPEARILQNHVLSALIDTVSRLGRPL
jgi:hypothetical protein